MTLHSIATWWSQISPNLQASILWAAPTFLAHHLSMRRHVSNETTKQTEQLKAHIDQQLATPAPKEPPA